MAFQTVFKRNELKYMLTLEQKEKILEAMSWVCRENPCPVNTQISREIDYFIDFHGKLNPTVFLSYEREAYYDKGGGDFRVTFDDNILCRQTDVNLCSTTYGTPILHEGKVLMELKCSGGIPLWMVEVLSRERNGNLEIMVSKQETRVAKL